MPHKRKKVKPPSDKYVARARALSKIEAERLMSRMRGRFARRLEDKRLGKTEVLALQLEYEDEELKAWRENVAKIRANDKA